MQLILIYISYLCCLCTNVHCTKYLHCTISTLKFLFYIFKYNEYNWITLHQEWITKEVILYLVRKTKNEKRKKKNRKRFMIIALNLNMSEH